MSSGVSGEQAALEQKVNEMMQQARVLEAHLNEIIAREAAVNRLLEEAKLASSAVQEVQAETEVESYVPVGVGVHMKVSVLKQLMGQKQQVSLRMEQIQVQVNEMVQSATSGRSTLGKPSSNNR